MSDPQIPGSVLGSAAADLWLFSWRHFKPETAPADLRTAVELRPDVKGRSEDPADPGPAFHAFAPVKRLCFSSKVRTFNRSSQLQRLFWVQTWEEAGGVGPGSEVSWGQGSVIQYTCGSPHRDRRMCVSICTGSFPFTVKGTGGQASP